MNVAFIVIERASCTRSESRLPAPIYLASCRFYIDHVLLRGFIGLSKLYMQNHLGLAMLDARKASGLTQPELGTLLGISKQAVSETERGERSMRAEELIGLAKLFSEKFEVATENLLPDIVSDLAARLRGFLEETSFPPEQLGKYRWLQSVLADLDHTYVGEIA